MKKLLSIIMVAVMVLTILVMPASATEFDSSQFKLFEKIVDYYGEKYREEIIANGYDEVYYHYSDKNPDEIEWALVYCCASKRSNKNRYGTVVGDRVLSITGGCGVKFSEGYGVYIKEIDDFVSLSQESLNYIIFWIPDFVKAIEDNEIGQAFGDVNEDDAIDVLDATCIQRQISGYNSFSSTDWITVKYSFYDSNIYISDFDRDGDLTIMDATAIQYKVAEVEVMPEDYNQMVLVEGPDEIGYMPGGSIPLPFSDFYDTDDTYTRIMEKYRDTVAIVKSKEQYDTLLSDDAPEVSDEFFEENWLLVSCKEVSAGAAFFNTIAVAGDTLYVKYDIYSSSSQNLPPICFWYIDIVTVDKDKLANVTDIVVADIDGY